MFKFRHNRNGIIYSVATDPQGRFGVPSNTACCGAGVGVLKDGVPLCCECDKQIGDGITDDDDLEDFWWYGDPNYGDD